MEVDLLALLRSQPSLTVFLSRLDAATLLSAITGAMTSTPALGVVTRVARSPVPTLGYAGTSTIANVVLAVIGGLLMRP